MEEHLEVEGVTVVQVQYLYPTPTMSLDPLLGMGIGWEADWELDWMIIPWLLSKLIHVHAAVTPLYLVNNVQ